MHVILLWIYMVYDLVSIKHLITDRRIQNFINFIFFYFNCAKFWVRSGTRYSFMDSELLSSHRNVNLRPTCASLSVSLPKNIISSDSPTSKRRYASRRNKDLQKWHSILPRVVWEVISYFLKIVLQHCQLHESFYYF